MLAGFGLVAPATAAADVFLYTGFEQQYTVPAGVTLVYVTAAGGDGAAADNIANSTGGHGAAVAANLPVTPGEALYVEVGGSGDFPNVNNGGGRGGAYFGSIRASGGGGASDVRTVSCGDESPGSVGCYDSSGSLSSRLLVAGGGGAGWAGRNGARGASGGDAGMNGSGPWGGGAPIGFGVGKGGVCVLGGLNGEDGFNSAGGDGGSNPAMNPESGSGGGGGGGGYFGAGGGGGCDDSGTSGGGGGGGSSFVTPQATNVAIGLDTTQDADGEIMITPTAPSSESPPTIAGPDMQGQSLTLAHGLWTNAPSSYADQWLRCDVAGSGCVAISGATAQAYSLGFGDVGHTLRVQELATNVGGTGGPVTSSPTGPVVESPASGQIAFASTSATTASFTFTCTGNPGQTCSETAVATAVEQKRGGKVVAVVARSLATGAHSVRRRALVKSVSVAVARMSFTASAGKTVTEATTLNRTGRTLLTQFYRLPVSISFVGTVGRTEPITFSYPRVHSAVVNTWRFYSSYTTVTELTATGLPPGAEVKVVCAGGGCPFGRRVRHAHSSRLALGALFNGSHLRPGAHLTVEITMRGWVGSVAIFTIQRDDVPSESTLCLPPGVHKPMKCA